MKPRRVITLPNGRQVTLGQYAKTWKLLLDQEQVPPMRLIGGFFTSPSPATLVLQTMRRGIHDRINRWIPGYGSQKRFGGSEVRRLSDMLARRVVVRPCDITCLPTKHRAKIYRRVTFPEQE